MKKSVFLINGFHHQSTEPSFDWLDDYFTTKGYKVFRPNIDWKYRVMTDYVTQFSDFYNQHKTQYNHVIGFSFGAMIAFITAPQLRPDGLTLCSLSPYFKEDLPTEFEWFVGKRRVVDFANYNARKIAQNIITPTSIFYGTKEGNKFPSLKARCEQAANEITDAKLIKVPNAPHDISDRNYIKAIKNNS